MFRLGEFSFSFFLKSVKIEKKMLRIAKINGKQEGGCCCSSSLYVSVCDSGRCSLFRFSLEHPTHTRHNYIIDAMYIYKADVGWVCVLGRWRDVRGGAGMTKKKYRHDIHFDMNDDKP